MLAVIGDNGAGKSTMVKVLCGAVVPDEGEVLLDGVPVHFTARWTRESAGSRLSTRIWPSLRPSTSRPTFFWAERCAAAEFWVPGFGYWTSAE